MTINNIQQTYFSETQATSSDQAVPANLLLAAQTLEMIQKAKKEMIQKVNHAVVDASQNSGAPSAQGLGSKRTEGAANSSAADSAWEALMNRLKRAAGSSDPQVYVNLLNYIADLPDDVLKSPEIQALLTTYKSMFQQMALALAQLESLGNDTDGGKQWLLDQIAKFQRISVVGDVFSSFLANLPQYIAKTTAYDSQGNPYRIWKTNDDQDPNAVAYPYKKYKNLIAILIATGQTPGAPIVANPMYAMMGDLMKEYMQHFIEKIKAAASAGQAFMILMSMFDDDYSGQEGSLANSTDMLTDLTNGVASPLLALAQDTSKDSTASEFTNAILLAKDVIASSPQFDSISGGMNDAISGLMTTATKDVDGKDTTIGALFDAYVKNGGDPHSRTLINLIAGFKNMASPAQGFINNIQQIGALFTGLSKQVSTHLSIVTNQDDSVIKMGNSAGSSKEAYQQMMSSFVHNQKPN